VLTITDSLGCGDVDSVFVGTDIANTVYAVNDYVVTEQNIGVQIDPLTNDLGASSFTILDNPLNLKMLILQLLHLTMNMNKVMFLLKQLLQ